VQAAAKEVWALMKTLRFLIFALLFALLVLGVGHVMAEKKVDIEVASGDVSSSGVKTTMTLESPPRE